MFCTEGIFYQQEVDWTLKFQGPMRSFRVPNEPGDQLTVELIGAISSSWW